MKKFVLAIALLVAFVDSQAQEMKVITIVESIVPMGLGRSRIVEHQSQTDYNNFTTERTDGKDSKQSNVKRSDAKIDAFSETKLLNFYSGVGINFQNIASNDALITSKINEMLSQGWTLQFVTSGVESEAGKQDGDGIFITRLFFYRD
ncbi:MAG: hypothetical protein HRT74_10860 [Flavobacteriales bacterium]|nr:hypothetical protein [Flavobacteriales bacterium]